MKILDWLTIWNANNKDAGPISQFRLKTTKMTLEVYLDVIPEVITTRVQISPVNYYILHTTY